MSFLFTIILFLQLLLGLVPLYFSRYSERWHKNETCSSPTYCHCCELCALKQKPGALLAQLIQLRLDLHSQKSQLQTVLITASGPQALNALVHRRRYTQGSRQNRCVSSQEALALRAKVSGKRVSQCPFAGGRLTAVVQALAVCAHCLRPFGVCEGYLSDVYGLTICIPLARRYLRMAEDCQLRTAYGGESNCIIKTKVCDASKWCISQTDFCPVL